jgi:5-methylcytosine-specific restriction enzyme A
MQFRAGNKAVREHSADGRALHLFEQEKKGYVRYKGEFALSSFEYREGTDRNQQSTRTIVFHLKAVSPEKHDIEDNFLQLRHGGLELSVDELEAMRRKAYAAASEIPG